MGSAKLRMKPQAIIHLWCPGIEETGGIQHYSACCVQALRELYPQAKIRVFSKNDLVSDTSSSVHAFGRWRGKMHTPVFAATGLAWALWERPDLILATHPHFMKALAPLTRLGIPCLTAAHGVEVWGQLQGRLGEALQQATGVLPVSHYTSAIIKEEAQVPEARLCVVPDTFRESQFTPGPKSVALLQRYGLTVDQPILLTVGRLSASERYKGQDQILRALPLLIRDLPDIRYIIGGRGDDESRLRAIVDALGLAQHVIFTGFIPESELADHYRLTDLYVMPSTGEGFGIVYLESLACGRPCLVGDQDASPEAIDDGRLGFVVPPRDSARIAEAILSFFQRTHKQPWLHEPQALRREVIKLYGQAAFRSYLQTALKKFLTF
jgi:glycosyltransferase involved in cell wall biosynthesis